MLDAVGSHLRDRTMIHEFCDQDQNVVVITSASDQAQFLQLNSLDPGHKCFYKREKWLVLKLYSEFRTEAWERIYYHSQISPGSVIKHGFIDNRMILHPYIWPGP